MTTIMTVLDRAASQATALASKKQVWTLGKPNGSYAIFAAGPGMPTYAKYAVENAACVICVEWRRNEGFSDDDLSAGGYFLLPDGQTVRMSAYASVVIIEGRHVVLAWKDEQNRSVTIPNSIASKLSESW